jgi:hypothetical protein
MHNVDIDIDIDDDDDNESNSNGKEYDDEKCASIHSFVLIV